MGAVRRDAIALWEQRRATEFPHLQPHIPLWDAISDLPPLEAGAGDEKTLYTGPPLTAYQRALRGRAKRLYDHQAASLPQQHLDAWDFTRGAGIRVAVIDNGFDVAHGDLSTGIVGESGFFDNAGNFQQTLTNYPNNDHGTFCAGMAAARHNNGVDGCGSAAEAELMLVATRGDQVGTQATLARAVAYAANPSMEIAGADPSTGADVIVSSLGPSRAANWALTAVLQNAIVFAAGQGRGTHGRSWAARLARRGRQTDPAQPARLLPP